MGAISLPLFILSVALVSLSGVMMPGPVFAVTVTKGRRNRMAGALIAVGHGVIEFPLMALIYVGFGWFFTSRLAKLTIGLAGGLMLIYMGIEMFKERKKIWEETGSLGYSSFVAGILTTSANPYFFLWWATVGNCLIIDAVSFGLLGFLLLAITHWLCDLSWDLFVSITVFKSGHFWTKRLHELVFGFCALILIGFGAWFILSALL